MHMTPESADMHTIILLTLGGMFLLGLVADLVGRRTPLPRVSLLLLTGTHSAFLWLRAYFIHSRGSCYRQWLQHSPWVWVPFRWLPMHCVWEKHLDKKKVPVFGSTNNPDKMKNAHRAWNWRIAYSNTVHPGWYVSSGVDGWPSRTLHTITKSFSVTAYRSVDWTFRFFIFAWNFHRGLVSTSNSYRSGYGGLPARPKNLTFCNA